MSDTASAHRDAVLAARQRRAGDLGLCGARFGRSGVCDEPAGHDPFGPGWEHAETVGGGPLGDLLDDLHELHP